MVDIARLRILVDLDSRGVGSGAAAIAASVRGIESTTVAGLGRATRSVSTFETQSTSSLGRAGRSFQSITNSSVGLASAVTGLSTGFLRVGAPIAAVGVSFGLVAREAIQFESAFAGVVKTVDGTPEQLADVRQGLIDLSTTIPTSAAELASIAEAAGQLGVEVPNILEFTRTIALLAESTDLDFNTAATSLARFLNVTEGGVDGIGDAANVIVALGNSTATTESQILQFAQRIAGAGTIAGATSSELLAVSATFSELGIEAEAGGTAVSQILALISDAAIDSNEDLHTLAETTGLTTDEFRTLAMESPVDALVLFISALDGIVASGGSVTPTLDALGLSGRRVTNALKLGSLGIENFSDNLDTASTAISENSALNEEAGRRFETTAAQIERLRNRITALAIAAGTPLLGVLVDGAILAGDAIERLAAGAAPLGPILSDAFSSASSALDSLGGALSGLADALGTTLANAAVAAGAFIAAFGGPALQAIAAGLTGAAVAATGVLQVLNSLGPVGLVLAGIVATIALYPPALLAARLAVSGLAVSLATAGAAGTAASAGAALFSAAISAGPLLIATAAVIGLGRGINEADRAANEAAQTFREGLAVALSGNTFEPVNEQVTALTTRIDELRGSLEEADAQSDTFLFGLIDQPEAIQGFLSGVDEGLEGIADGLGIVEGSTIATRAELEALESLLVETGAENYRDNIQNIADVLNISTDEAVAYAAELGLVDGLHMQSAIGTAAAAAAIRDKMAADADAAATTERNALATGMTTEAYVEQVGAVRDLIAAQNGLASAITGTQNAFLGLNDPFVELLRLEGLLEAAFADTSGIDTSTEGLIAFSEVGDNAVASIFALIEAGTPLPIVRQRLAELQEQLLTLGVQGGLTETQITTLAAGLFALDDVTLASLVSEIEGAGITINEFLDRASERVRMGLPPLELDADDSPAQDVITQLLIDIGLVDPDDIPIGLDQTSFDMAVSAVQQALIDLESQNPVVTVEADTEPAEVVVEGFEDLIITVVDGEYMVELRADGSQADEVTQQRIADLEAFLNGRFGEGWEARITADGSVAEQVTEARMQAAMDFANGGYMATLEANPQPAESSTASAMQTAEVFARTGYMATLEANPAPAESSTNSAMQTAEVFARTGYEAQLTGDGSDAEETARQSTTVSRRFADGTYRATLTAVSGQAVTAINAAVNALSRFTSRRITLTTIRRGGGAGNVIRWGGITELEDGGILDRSPYGLPASRMAAAGVYPRTERPARPERGGGRSYPNVERYQTGGFSDAALSAGVVANPGAANIFTPATPFRIFAEPAAGWEAFIPQYGDRLRNRIIWETTGRRLGFMQHGGIAVTHYQNGGIAGATPNVNNGDTVRFDFSPTVDVTVNGGGNISGDEVAQLVSTGVRRELDVVARDLLNTRVRR